MPSVRYDPHVLRPLGTTLNAAARALETAWRRASSEPVVGHGQLPAQ
ncbi:hypothetical protein ACFCYB_22865 [Streptomyces sp. NPDC056309]